MNVGIKLHHKKAGTAPGTLIYTGLHRDIKPEITVINYNKDAHSEIKIETKDINGLSADGITWINIDGLTDISLIEEIGKKYSLHPLVMEDILSINQRPKVEFFDDYIFIVLKMIYFSDENALTFEQVSIILTENTVISFQEQPKDVLEAVRNRIRTGKGIIRQKTSDYLCYCLIDSITDNYFSVMESFGEDIEDLEEEIIENPNKNTISYLHQMKRVLAQLRKSVWPIRELVNNIQKSESKFIRKDSNPYFRDIYDHSIQIMDTIESHRELVSGLLDIYLSSLSNRMNEVMKVLTIIATIFIPLTFIAGVYGMNFSFMPELNYRWAYPAVLGLMFVILIGMVAYFRKKKWL